MKTHRLRASAPLRSALSILFILSILCGCSQKPAVDPNAARLDKLEKQMAEIQDKLDALGSDTTPPAPRKGERRSNEARSQVESVPSGLGLPEVLSVKGRITEMNDIWWRFANILVLANTNDSPVTCDYGIKYLDKDGYAVDMIEAYNIRLEPHATNTYTPFRLVDLPGARNVKSFKAYTVNAR